LLVTLAAVKAAASRRTPNSLGRQGAEILRTRGAALLRPYEWSGTESARDWLHALLAGFMARFQEALRCQKFGVEQSGTGRATDQVVGK
jgi:hypothetical protein